MPIVRLNFSPEALDTLEGLRKDTGSKTLGETVQKAMQLLFDARKAHALGAHQILFRGEKVEYRLGYRPFDSDKIPSVPTTAAQTVNPS